MNEWLDSRKEDINAKLLKADSMEKVIGLQKEHEAYNAVQVKVKTLAQKGP